MIKLFSKESGKSYEIPFFENETFGLTAQREGMKEKWDVYGEQNWARDFIGWEVDTDIDAEWWQKWGKTAEKADRSWKKLNVFLNGYVPEGYKGFPVNGTLDDVSRYFCNHLTACDENEIYSVRKDIVSLHRELIRDIRNGKVLKHVEKNMRSDFDFVNYDIIKGVNGNCYIKGEGGANSIFGKESKTNPGFRTGGSGTFLVSQKDYIREKSCSFSR